MTTVLRGQEVRGDSLWLAGEPHGRSARRAWPRAAIGHLGSQLTSLASWIVLASGSGTRRAARFLALALALAPAPASALAVAWEATRAIRARLEAVEADRPPSALPLAHLGLTVAAGIHGFGLVALWLSGRTVSIILAEGVLLAVASLAAAAACVFVVGRERTLAARQQHEEERLAEIAASFHSSDWRRRIGGS